MLPLLTDSVNREKAHAMFDLPGEIVRAIAAGAGDSLGSRGVAAAGRLISALRRKFRGDPESRGVLEIALESPDDLPVQEDLVSLLRRHILADPAFSEWLESLWSEVGPDLQVDTSRSVNIVHGEVRGNVIQSRDVHGGIHLGSSGDAGLSSDRDASH